MNTSVKPVPDGYSTATPYLIIKNATAALDFYARAFGATEAMRFSDPSGKIGHAEIRIGNSVIMLSDESPELGVLSPQSTGGSSTMIHLYVEDVDAFVNRAVEAGAQLAAPVQDHFYGDRGGKLVDPFGHVWWVASHIEDVPPQEIEKRAVEMFGNPIS